MVGEIVSKYIRWRIRKLNNEIDWDRFTTAVGLTYDAEKVVTLHTTDVDGSFSFRYGNGKMEWLDHTPLEPTVEIWCNERTFKAIITGKLGPDQAFYGNLCEFRGASLLAEKIAANLFFDVVFGDRLDDFKKQPDTVAA